MCASAAKTLLGSADAGRQPLKENVVGKPSAATVGEGARAVMACASCERVAPVQLYEMLAGVRASGGEVVWLCTRCVRDQEQGYYETVEQEDARRDFVADRRLEARRCGDE